MSPGPATYRSQVGFDSFRWNPTDVRSPDFVHRRRRSAQLSQASPLSSGKTKETWNPGTGETVPSQDAIMGEVYGRLVRTVKIEIKDTRQGGGREKANYRVDNAQKEDFLQLRETVCKEQMAECRSDVTVKGRDINDSILNGEVAVKIIRVPTGRLIGPGTYEQDNGMYETRTKDSHNLKGDRQFRELVSIKNRRSPQKGKEASRLITTFYEETGKESLTRMFRNADQSLLTPNKSGVWKSASRYPTPASCKTCKTPSRRLFNISPDATTNGTNDSQVLYNQTATTDSKENPAIKEFDVAPPPANLPTPTHGGLVSGHKDSFRKDAATPEFQRELRIRRV